EHAEVRNLFFALHASHADHSIAGHAVRNLQGVPLSQLKALGPYLDRKQIRRAILNAGTPFDQRNLCWMLLALCSKDDDTKYMKSLLQSRSNQGSVTYVAIAYVILRSEEGLTQMDDWFFRNPNPHSVTKTRSIISGMDELCDHYELISRARLIQSL